MLNHTPIKWTPIIALSIIVASLIALVMIVPQFDAPTDLVSNLSPSAAQSTPTPSLALLQARALIMSVREEIIPHEGAPTQYGVTFSDAGYQTLIQWNQDFQVEPRYADAFESLDLILPCCDWRTPSRDEETNCGCGHHQALEGLSKKLLSEGYSRDAAQREVTLWARFMFPVTTLRAELERRALLDPETEIALNELRARGEC